MSYVKCPTCGGDVEIPGKKSGLPWLIGCLVALVAVPIVVGMIGLLAAIAIPSFVKARSTAQMNACVSNLRMIDSAKEQWAIENKAGTGQAVDEAAVSRLLPNGAAPACPARGVYSYRAVGEDPACSVHGPLSNPHAATQGGGAGVPEELE